MRRQQRAAQRAAQISLQELKTHLRIEQVQVEEDAYLQTLLTTAHEDHEPIYELTEKSLPTNQAQGSLLAN